MVKDILWRRLDLGGDCSLFYLDCNKSQTRLANMANFQRFLVGWTWFGRLERYEKAVCQSSFCRCRSGRRKRSSVRFRTGVSQSGIRTGDSFPKKTVPKEERGYLGCGIACQFKRRQRDGRFCQQRNGQPQKTVFVSQLHRRGGGCVPAGSSFAAQRQ